MNTLKFVIVGDVDHGKSTLIGRLLYDTNSISSDKIEEIKKISEELGREPEFAYLLDHLEEERKQRVTIDTTQVFFKTKRREYVIIDAPGHVEFVKNMITGASQAEAAVLIVDVKEGIQTQTKRHAYILSLLGLNQVIVALNKMDLVNFEEGRFNEVKREVQEFLNTININPLFYIPICAITGENITKKSEKMNWYKDTTFLESLDILKNSEPVENKYLIFPVQDIYKINDKRIIVGKIEAGIIRCGDNVKILPHNTTVTINSIEKYLEEDIRVAYAGESIGVTINESVLIDRGNIICSPYNEPTLTNKFTANIFWLARRNFNKDDQITIRCATQETTCKIERIKKKIDSSTLAVIQEDLNLIKNLEVAEVIIKTERPIAIKTFNDVPELGRFVLVHKEDVCAGGTITEI